VPTALDVVDGEVRELIGLVASIRPPTPRRSGCWCATSPTTPNALTSALPPIGDPESVVRMYWTAVPPERLRLDS
jgi:pilus assembly protein CpaF